MHEFLMKNWNCDPFYFKYWMNFKWICQNTPKTADIWFHLSFDILVIFVYAHSTLSKLIDKWEYMSNKQNLILTIKGWLIATFGLAKDWQNSSKF